MRRDADRPAAVHRAAEQGAAEVVEQETLQGTLHGARAKLGVEAGRGDEADGTLVHREADLLRLQAAHDGIDLQAHDLADFRPVS